MADPDAEVNRILEESCFNFRDEYAYYWFLLIEIASHSDGQLKTDTKFLAQHLRDPEKGSSLKEKLAKAWHEKKYQSIRDIGKIYRLTQWFSCVFDNYLTAYLQSPDTDQ